jgi:hypothetical protein
MHLSQLYWFLVGSLMFVGLAGTILPLLPGTGLILSGVLLYEWLLATPETHLGAATLIGMGGLVVVSYLIDFVTMLMGANRFGASKLGIYGAMIGLFVGIFFSLPGLLLGPPLGVISGELAAGKRLPEALRACWGTVLGGAAGMFGRFAVGLGMVVWFAVAVWR